ncbi:MAG: chemotaxis protein CheW [Methanospirillum sp.]|uniref:chemotaxis protein CheW n=1 Tax=Methanospirillum sp. TaxID=45200 RepID=UPI00236B8B8C|nr:chemotaxis protein CheW [Methanospirillum sp.]MDD1729765.1 chemotaxis protein CheW [Methanospirillum sp.]
MGTIIVDPSSEIPETDLSRTSLSSRVRKGKNNDDMQFVEFMLGHEYFAVNLFHTREVITPTEITPLPNTPAYIRGVMDLRGSITTIIDLKILLNLTDEIEQKKRSRIIILDQEASEKPVGILVDDVYSVSTHHADDIDRNAEDEIHTIRNILGVIRKNVKDGHKLILWLDIQAIRASIEKDL